MPGNGLGGLSEAQGAIEERTRFVPTKIFIALFGNWFHRLGLVGTVAFARASFKFMSFVEIRKLMRRLQDMKAG